MSSLSSNIDLSDFDFSTSIKDMCENNDCLQQIVDFAQQADSGKIEINNDIGDSGINLSGSYSIDKLDFRSSGEGSLEAWLDGTISLTVNSFTSSSKISTSIIFKNYLFSSTSITYSGSMSESQQAGTISLTNKTEATYDVKISKPSLK